MAIDLLPTPRRLFPRPTWKHIRLDRAGPRHIVIGMSDGLTVPFAWLRGLSGAVNSPTSWYWPDWRKIAAGSIAMGLGGFLAAQGDAEHYVSERLREEREIVRTDRDEEEENLRIFGNTA